MFMRARCVIVVKDGGEMSLVTSDRGVVPVPERFEGVACKVETFQTAKGDRMLVIGCETGEVVVKDQ
jgi:hypothetical protein